MLPEQSFSFLMIAQGSLRLCYVTVVSSVHFVVNSLGSTISQLACQATALSWNDIIAQLTLFEIFRHGNGEVISKMCYKAPSFQLEKQTTPPKKKKKTYTHTCI